MKGLILFRSHFGNTKLVADSIARQLAAQGHEAIVQDVRQKLPELQPLDLVFIGCPTRFARADGKALNVLKELKNKGFTQKPVVIFDTYGPEPAKPGEPNTKNRWLYPGAAGMLQRTAVKQGLNVYGKTLRCTVQGGQKGPLAANQLEKTVEFTSELLSGIEERLL